MKIPLCLVGGFKIYWLFTRQLTTIVSDQHERFLEVSHHLTLTNNSFVNCILDIGQVDYQLFIRILYTYKTCINFDL